MMTLSLFPWSPVWGLAYGEPIAFSAGTFKGVAQYNLSSGVKNTNTASHLLVPQGLSGLQCELNALLSLLFTAERFEGLALQVEQVLLAD